MGHPARVRAHAEGNADPYGMTNKKGKGKGKGNGKGKGEGEGRWVGVAMRGRRGGRR